jgi:hypothetical protein
MEGAKTFIPLSIQQAKALAAFWTGDQPVDGKILSSEFQTDFLV